MYGKVAGTDLVISESLNLEDSLKLAPNSANIKSSNMEVFLLSYLAFILVGWFISFSMRYYFVWTRTYIFRIQKNGWRIEGL